MKRLKWLGLASLSVFLIWRVFSIDRLIEILPRSVWSVIDSIVLAILTFLLIAVFVFSIYKALFEKDKPEK